jgi:hypothetical protein
LKSELLFAGDAGTTEASRPSRRVGIEWTNSYRVDSWLAFDFDLAVTKARFTAFEPSCVATADRHIHPAEPFALRLTFAGPF